MPSNHGLRIAMALGLSAWGTAFALGQDWPHPGRDAGGTRHSPLTQIDRKNVATLEVAWTFDTGDVSDGTALPTRTSFAATPLMIDGVLYVPSPFSRLFALDAETGTRPSGSSIPPSTRRSRGTSS